MRASNAGRVGIADEGEAVRLVISGLVETVFQAILPVAMIIVKFNTKCTWTKSAPQPAHTLSFGVLRAPSL